jgi:F0F1-type ATP synthase assembly protein I
MGGGEPGRQRNEPTKVVDSALQAEEDRLKRTRLRLIGLSLQFGFTIVGSLMVFLVGGIWLDRRLGTQPLFVLVGMVLAFISIGYNLYELATIGSGPRKPAAKAPQPAASKRPAPPSAWDDEDREDEDDWPVRPRTGGKGKEG